jgi:hypothetical protein
MDWKLVTYLIYAGASVGLTIWVGRTLFRNGTVFLEDVFEGKPLLAAAINRLLIVGFYLVNFGFVSLALQSDTVVGGATVSVELLSRKLGLVLLVLGGLHLFNVLVLARTRRHRSNELQQRPPVPPSGMLPMPGPGFGPPPVGPQPRPVEPEPVGPR